MATAIANSSYMKLVGDFPLRPIRSDLQLKEAIRAMERLAVREENTLDDGEQDYLDVLCSLISEYEAEHYPMPTKRGTPAQKLKALMEHAGVTPTELEKILSVSQAAVSLILSGKRGISKANIVRLKKRFPSMSAEYFM